MTIDPMHRRGLIAVGVILVLFGVLGALRLNPFCLLEPDSPDYLFTSRALVTLQGYTEIDHPQQPPHAFRPPGLPLLLAPVSAMFPGSVVAAKILLLGLSIVALLLLWVLARRMGGAPAGVSVLLVVATGPYTLLHATEVVSEMPFLAVLLASLLLATREEEPSPVSRVAMALLLGLLPLLRTVGLIWLAAFLGWSVATRSRRWWAPIGAALLVNAAWMLRNQRTGVVTYFSGMLHDYRELGLVGYLGKSFDAAGFYLESWFEVLLPGVFAGPPLYERFLLEPARTLNGLWGFGYLVGLLVSGLAIGGCVARWRKGGALVLPYAIGSVAVLLVYPARHERLIWPLVPLLWIFVPAGVEALRSWSTARVRPFRPPLVALVAAPVALLVLWQAWATVSSVQVNGGWRADRDGFHQARVPPMYYADWGAAGRWLARQVPPSAVAGTRVLTRHSDIGFTSKLSQDSVRFEEISPAELHRRIAALTPRYLALPATRFRWLVPSYLLQGSPVYRFEPVYESGDVLLVEVLPNREGIVRRRSPGLGERITACRDAVERVPRRVDLRRRLGQLLHEAGRDAEALDVLDALDSAEGHATVGRIHLDRGDGDAALDAYRRAETAPGAGRLTGTITRGVTGAEELRALSKLPVEQRVRHHLERVSRFVQALLFDSAWAALDRAAALAPADPQVVFMQALLLERTGEYAQAQERFDTLARRGYPDAAAAAEQLRRERALMRGETTATAEAWLGIAARRAAQGLVGRALSLLERAGSAHPGSAEIRQGLGDLQAVYGDIAAR